MKTDQMIDIQNLIRATFLLIQENLFLMLIFTFTPLRFPWKLLWCNLSKHFYLVPLVFLPHPSSLSSAPTFSY